MRACCMLYKNRAELYEIEERKLTQPPIEYNLDLRPRFKARRKTSSRSTSVPLNSNNKTNITVRLGEFKSDSIVKSMSTRNIRIPRDRVRN